MSHARKSGSHDSSLLVANAHVFVLILVARLQGGLPSALVALGPFGTGVHAGAGIVVPGLGVGLALVLALVIHDYLLAFTAAGETGRSGQGRGHNDELTCADHDFAPCG